MEIIVALDDLNKTEITVTCDSWESGSSGLVCKKDGKTVAMISLSGIRYFGEAELIKERSDGKYGERP